MVWITLTTQASVNSKECCGPWWHVLAVLPSITFAQDENGQHIRQGWTLEIFAALLVKLVPIRIGENSKGSPSSMDRGLLIFCFDQCWESWKDTKSGRQWSESHRKLMFGVWIGSLLCLFSYLAALAGSRETCDSCWRHFWTHKKHKGSWKQLLQQLHFRGVFVAL